MKSARKIFALLICSALILSASGCDKGGMRRSSRSIDDDDEIEETEEETTTGQETEETSEETDKTEETSEETSEETTEESTEETSEETEESSIPTPTPTPVPVYDPVEQVLFLQNMEDIQRAIPVINVPGHDYAENRVEFPGIGQVRRVYFEEFDDVFFSVRIRVSEDDDNAVINQGFVLEGINFPPLAGENQTYFCHEFTAPMISFEWVIDRLIGHRTIYVETDGVLDEHGQLHGYVYFDQDTTTTNGAATEDSNFVQLNEWLLAHGFAEPDPDYTGPYADIYAQYPSFNTGLAGYPIIEPTNIDLDGNGVYDGVQQTNVEPGSFANSIIFYDPALDADYYGNSNPYSRVVSDHELRERGEAFYDTADGGTRIRWRDQILENYPEWSFETWANG